MRILGLSCDYHDAAAALVVDGAVVAAAEEERFTRRKHDAAVPEHAVAACLATAGIGPDDLDAVVFHEKPLVTAGRFLASRQQRGVAGVWSFARDMPQLLRTNLLVGYRLEQALRRLGATVPQLLFYGEHHRSHAAAAFLPSPFETAAVLTIDGVGEWATASIGHGVGGRVDLLAEQRFPHSVGLLYSLVTLWCGFEPNDGEYKLMGLAPYGAPRFADELRQLATVHDDGSVSIDARLVRWWSGRVEGRPELAQLFGGPPRQPGDELGDREADLARSVQELVEEIVLRMARHAAELTGERRLCLGGGVALNCVANGRLLREGPFDEVWVQPAPGDSGSALGAALWYWHEIAGHARRVPGAGDAADGAPGDAMQGAQLGPEFTPDEIEAALVVAGSRYRRTADDEELCDVVAGRLADGHAVGWFQGRMEFGPRALGQRSILCDPRSETARSHLNLRVKGRESFRPFAPAVMWERASEWFEIDRPAPYMVTTHDVVAARRREGADEPATIEERSGVARSEIPACTHVDGSARVQTVHRDTSPLFHRLLDAFDRRTGCPVLVNTSFNTAGEPIVCTPADALATAARARLDLLAIGPFLVEGADLP